MRRPSLVLLSAVGAIGAIGGVYAALVALGNKLDTWGTTPDEQKSRVPGDDYLAHPHIESTMAITIAAPRKEVWPWLIQIGRGRGGFYSYTWLENLFGSGIQNVDRIIPELQTLREGDRIQLHPKAPPLTVTYLVPNQTLAIEGWIFHLSPHESGGTRLLSRTYAIAPSTKIPPVWNFVFQTRLWRLAHFIMQRKMLTRIKQLAEQARQAKVSAGTLAQRQVQDH